MKFQIPSTKFQRTYFLEFGIYFLVFEIFYTKILPTAFAIGWMLSCNKRNSS